ncbi:zinc finger protein 28 homolog [Ruditapes philippinarum]|uniref:zinc finger protein 28 homolog n=1 Tax=Ruditapes philippinarum TaxID=129788 RepID=UPI00295BA64E|nr:zinc finger protein 28 homolog [Ruditapes philippinarum]
MEFNSWLNIFGFKPLTENDSSEESDHNNNLLIPDIQDVALSNAVAESAGETAEVVLEEESVNEGKTAVCLVLPKESDDKLEEKGSVKRVDASVFGVHGEESVGNVSEVHVESVDKVKAIDFELQEERLEERDDTLGMDVEPRVTFQEIGEVTVSTNKKSFECSICNKTYTLKASLKRHMNVHNTEGGLNCSVCGKTYYILSAFNQHKKCILLHVTDAKCVVKYM